MVTSTDSGLAVPDWPNTYGQFMFSFPLEKMVGGIFYEHGHRMIASTVGFLTIILAIWTWKADPRRWVGKLGITALGAVILQGLLGGITVLLLLPAPVSIGHAGLAQLFFCLTISLALFTSPGWTKSQTAVDDPTLRRIAVATTVMVYGQIILGATMRHIEAGMAIPDFPLAFGHLVPPFWNAGSGCTSRIGWARSSSRPRSSQPQGTSGSITATRRELVRPAALLTLFVLVQICLGAFVIWSRLQPIINTAHVVNGALVLADVARADAAFVPLSLCRYAADHCRCRRARRSAAGSDATRQPGAPSTYEVDRVRHSNHLHAHDRPRRARQAAPQHARGGVGRRRLRDGERRYA